MLRNATQIGVDVSAVVIDYNDSRYLHLLLMMYKLKGFILSVTIVSLFDVNNTGFGRPTVRGPARHTELEAKPIFFYQNSGPDRVQSAAVL